MPTKLGGGTDIGPPGHISCYLFIYLFIVFTILYLIVLWIPFIYINIPNFVIFTIFSPINFFKQFPSSIAQPQIPCYVFFLIVLPLS